jgi:protein involved in polysaccharide export with SLBB domain
MKLKRSIMVTPEEQGTRETTCKTVARRFVYHNCYRSVADCEQNMMSRLVERKSLTGVAALVLALLTACQTATQTPLPEQPTAQTPVNLAPGDVVKLAFVGAPELNQSQKIRADGKLSLPLVGEVAAAGKTLVGFQSELIRLYKPQLRNSDVVVTLERGTAEVVVSGNVKKPGKLTFDRPTTVFQAIMEAGGVGEYGNLKKVHLIRIVNGEQLTQVVDLKPALSGKSTSALYVKDGDVIYVPQSMF